MTDKEEANPMYYTWDEKIKVYCVGEMPPQSQTSLEEILKLIGGEIKEIEWYEPCPTCGNVPTKLMWNKHNNKLYCNDAYCTGWTKELEPFESTETDIIKDMQLALMEKKLAEDGLLETLHNIKTACILQVEEEWENTKDKALSNATKRNAEVELRLSGDDEYTMRQRQQDELHREIQRDQIELDFQRRQFQRQMAGLTD